MERLDEKVYCAICNRDTNHTIIYTYKQQSSPDDDFHWHEKSHIVQCLGCDEIAFVRQYGDEDSWDYINGEREWVDTFKVYPGKPAEDIGNLFEKNFYLTAKRYENAPEIISNLYLQIIEAFNKNLDILCASGIRTLIEGICTQLKIKKGYLYDRDGNRLLDDKDVIRKHESLGGRIFELYDKKFIIFTQALILQKIVKFGNGAVHDMESPGYKTLKEIINIIEKVIYDIYELENHSFLKD